MRPVVAHLRARGHRVFAYLDDFFGAARRSSSKCATTGDTKLLGEEIQDLFRKLGLLLHPRKCDFSGSKRVEILGIVVDTEKALFLLSAAKLSKIEVQARRLLRYAAQHRRQVRVTHIRGFAGLGNSVTPAVVDARLRLRELFDSCKLRHVTEQGVLHGRGSTRLSHAAMRDLQWWARLSENCHIGRALWPTVDAVVFTAASMSGWGAAWNGQVPASGFFDAQHEGAHIKELELLAAHYALRSFVRHARRRSVELVIDSKVTEFIVRNMTPRSPRLLARLRELRTLCEAEGVVISTRHIPSVLNTWAGRLSRRLDSHGWTLPPTTARLLERRLDRKLHMCDGHELLSHMPLYGEPLVLPRPALLPVWSRLLQRRGRGVLVVRAWREQSWFGHAVERRAQVLELEGQVLTSPWKSVAIDYAKQPVAAGKRKGRVQPVVCSPTRWEPGPQLYL